MGVELIENSELGALAPSRLGNSFIDDSYSYIVRDISSTKTCRNPSDTECINKQADAINMHIMATAEQRKQDAITKVVRQWELESNDCNYIKSKIEQLKNHLTKEFEAHKYDTNLNYFDIYIDPLQNVLIDKYGSAFQNNKCVGLEAPTEESLAKIKELAEKRRLDKEKAEAEENRLKAEAEAEAKARLGLSQNAQLKTSDSVTENSVTDNKKLIIGAGILFLVTFILMK